MDSIVIIFNLKNKRKQKVEKIKKIKSEKNKRKQKLEMRGIDPRTSRMLSERSTI